MSEQGKIALWALVGIVAVLIVLIVASNLALLFTGSHDGQFHFFSIFVLVTSSSEHVASAAHLALIVTGGGALLAAAAIWRTLSEKPLHGAARWANERDIRKAGLRGKRGIVVGKKDGHYLIFGGQEHVMVYAPTRGGKGVGIVIPNLLNWSDSAIVLDIKKENWELTAGFRKAAGHEVYLFDPFDREGRTARYNPLAYVRRDNPDDIYDGLQRIAHLLYPKEPNTESIWYEGPRTAFLAIAGYIAETPELPFTFGEVMRQFAPTQDIKRHFRSILEQRRQQGRPLSQQCQTAMNDFLTNSDNTLQSIRTSTTSKLGLWLNSRVDAATTGNDFDLRELRRRPMTIYLGVTPDNMERMAPLLNLFFQQIVDLNTQVRPEDDKNLKLQVMLMMDEFRQMGNVAKIANGISYIAGYGLRAVTIIQSASQLYEVYGPYAAANYMTNHAVEVVFTPKEHTIATELSERFGYDTVDGRSRSRAVGFSRSNRTETTSDQRRALMLPQELVLTPFKDEYVIKSGIPPVRARKILYYKDPVFTKRLLPAPKVEPMRRSSDNRIALLERRIEALSQSLSEKVSRVPQLEEIAAEEQPADGEDGNMWTLPHNLETAFAHVKLTDNPEKVRRSTQEKVSAWLESVAVERGRAA